MTRNVDLSVKHVISTTEFASSVNYTFIPGSTLVLDFPYFHHPVSQCTSYFHQPRSTRSGPKLTQHGIATIQELLLTYEEAVSDMAHSHKLDCSLKEGKTKATVSTNFSLLRTW